MIKTGLSQVTFTYYLLTPTHINNIIKYTTFIEMFEGLQTWATISNKKNNGIEIHSTYFNVAYTCKLI